MMPTNNKTPASAATANAAIVLPDEPDETLIQNNQYAYIVQHFHQQLDFGAIRSDDGGINTK